MRLLYPGPYGSDTWFCSCFPIVPKLACSHLGLSISTPEKPITLLGGLTSFGGAGNNYSMHAITELVRRLRNPPKKDEKTGLVLANGGVLTYQHVVVLSSTPPSSSYPAEAPLPEILPPRVANPPRIATAPRGKAVIETYTVSFARDGGPETGYVVGRLKETGERFVANEANEETLRELSNGEEMIGQTGWVQQENGGKRLLWSFRERRRL